MSVEGKHILVTGATSGIGLSAAKTLAHAGATVTLSGRNPDKLRHAAGAIGRAEYINTRKPLRLKAWARDDDDAQRLWEVGESLVDFIYSP